MIYWKQCPQCRARYIAGNLFGLRQDWIDAIPYACVRCGTLETSFEEWSGPCASEVDGFWPLRQPAEPDAAETSD